MGYKFRIEKGKMFIYGFTLTSGLLFFGLLRFLYMKEEQVIKKVTRRHRSTKARTKLKERYRHNKIIV